MVDVTVFVEGGGDTNHLRAACREGLSFKPNALPTQSRSIEGIDKQALYQSLKTATAHCKTKAEYGKGAHSFKLLALIDPAKVIGASGWAERFIDELKRRMGL